jgi:hypothetical protein
VNTVSVAGLAPLSAATMSEASPDFSPFTSLLSQSVISGVANVLLRRAFSADYYTEPTSFFKAETLTVLYLLAFPKGVGFGNPETATQTKDLWTNVERVARAIFV